MKANAILKVDDVNGNEIKKSLPNVNPLYVPKYDEDINSDKAAKVKAACQALNALTTNTFKALDLESTADITDARTLNPAELTLDPSFGWYDSIDGIQESTKIVNSYSWNVQTMSGGAPYARVVSGDASAISITYNELRFTVTASATGKSAIVEIGLAETSSTAKLTKYALIIS